MSKKLIVNADDFGIHTVVNRAIYRGFESGILTSTSIMACGEAFKEAVELARTMDGVGIGIHLTLVGGLPPVLPASEVPSLTWDGGLFTQDYLKLLKRDMQGKIIADDVYREWDAQIQTVLETGLPVTHVDGHQHLHMWNRYFPIALTLCKKYGIRCMRVPDENVTFGFRPSNAFRAAARSGLSLMARGHRKMLKEMHIITNDHFYGMLYGGHFTEERMGVCMDHLEDGVTEFMCHPSADMAAIEAKWHWGYRGEEELRALLSPKLKNKLKEKGVTLISYRDLMEAEKEV